jgi:DNA-binding response OmpR family regulator
MKVATRVLLVDDDEALTALLVEYLARFDMVASTAAHPQDAFRILKSSPPDVMVLDVMLPGMDGFAVCRKVRETSSVPIVMLTARGDVTDRVVGLELGADDYVPKPFEPRELVARIQAVLRRRTSQPDEVVRAGELEVSVARRAVRLRGEELPLTTAEFDLLALFVRHPNRVLTRERLLDETRGVDWEAYDRSIDVLVSRLRQKLGDDARRPRFIRTVRRTGYSFIGNA